MRAQLRWLGLALTTLGFIWVYNGSKGNGLQSLNMAVKIATLFFAVDAFLKHREEWTASGMSKEQFMLSKAGGPTGLLRQAKGARLGGYFLIVFWLGMSLLLVVSAAKIGLFVFGILGLIIVPCSIFLFRLARSQSDIAHHAQRMDGAQTSP